MTKKHTLESIARLAGVSRATVSRVINDESHVRPEVRERVMECIRRERYYPNAPARSLAANRTNTIGIVDFGSEPRFLENQLFYEIIQGVQRAASLSNLDIMLFSSTSSDAELCHRIIGRRSVDGIVVTGAHVQAEHLRVFYEERLPMVLVGKRDTEDMQIPFVCSDYASGSYAAVEHLLATGRRNIAIVQCLPGALHEKERYEAHVAALQARGNRYAKQLICGEQDLLRDAYDLTRQLLKDCPEVDGIFATNDLTAQGVVQGVQSLQLTVPDDVSVVGFDDLVSSATFSPPLTTVHQDKRGLGEQAVGMLVQLIGGKEVEPVVLPATLVVRKTTCAATAP